MACSNPFKLYESQLKTSLKKNHSNFTQSALKHSFGNNEYFQIPCRYCLNCKVDRQNELVDRAEYEYIQYGCGAFVTFTYDDVHNFKNSFIDSHSGEPCYTINKKDGKDFLNRLNKLVHEDNKKTGYNPLCRKDYKYLLTAEYGDKFQRNHFHVLFFGLDFAYCERLFWKAWNYQGSIEVGAIKNGGIAYATKYISDQLFGIQKRYQYNYHHLIAPYSTHSLGFGEGLYKGQLSYIKKHNGNYRWHGIDRPVPSYYKNKYKIISDLDSDYLSRKYKADCNKIYSLYEHRIISYKDFQNYNLEIAKRRQSNLEKQLHNMGKQVLDYEYFQKQVNDFIYQDNHRLNPKNDNMFVRVLKPDGTSYGRLGKKNFKFPLKTTDLMKLKTDTFKIRKYFGNDIADDIVGIPF